MMEPEDLPSAREGFFSRLTWHFRAIGVFWPSVVLVLLFFGLFCYTDVGRDIVLFASGSRWTLPIVLVALVFAAFTVWYSARLLGFFHLTVLEHAKAISIHLPRFMGFSVFTVVAFAFSLPPMANMKAGYLWGFLVVYLISFGWYRLLVHRIRLYAARNQDAAHARWWLSVLLGGLLLACVGSAISTAPWVTITCILVAQFCYTVQVGARKEWAPLLDTTNSLTAAVVRHPTVQRLVAAARRRLDAQRVPAKARPKLTEEVVFFTAFNIIAVLAMALFIASDTHLPFAQLSRPLPIAITGFAIVLGIINFLRLVGRIANVNILFWSLFIAFLMGMKFDAHSVRTVPTEGADEHMISTRPSFADAAADWMEARLDSSRSDSGRTAYPRIPMVFVLSDGGGARSARWVTHVLGQLDSASHGRFRQHLFSLSGASGGSVGNITYYGLLRKGTPPDSIGLLADRVTGADMLSFTVARMLGNDLLNLFCPAFGDTLFGLPRILHDRAAAVEDGFAAAGRAVGLELDAPITHWVDNDSIVPLFCINTTRVQDARPAVISSFALASDSAFNGRLDVLADMLPEQTLSAASSAVLSARFPYVTPGGSVRMLCAPDSTGVRAERSDLFVDGGYFDNSGAGLVLEMLMELECNARTWELYRYFEPIVLHISNGDPRETDPAPVNSVVNDLLAPVVTIVGAYGEQTDVNNQRLARYLANQDHAWVELNLFKGVDGEYYPMSWVMSQAPADSMRMRARTHPAVQQWGAIMAGW
ncbi:MAG TPA: hypothetical protein PLR96_07615 [Flavobacteriales bacterium]|jgi:hypothetical protein|nr:hypothetical protein [Flavobacteriales bacterium]